MNQSKDVLQAQISCHLFENLIILNTYIIYEKIVISFWERSLSSVVNST